MPKNNPRLAAVMAAATRKKQKVSIFDREGRLLWFSTSWMEHTGPMEINDALGFRWLELLATPEDEARARTWIAAPKDGAVVSLLCASGVPGDGRWVRCVMVKKRVGKFWVAVGDNRVEYDETPSKAAKQGTLGFAVAGGLAMAAKLAGGIAHAGARYGVAI